MLLGERSIREYENVVNGMIAMIILMHHGILDVQLSSSSSPPRRLQTAGLRFKQVPSAVPRALSKMGLI